MVSKSNVQCYKKVLEPDEVMFLSVSSLRQNHGMVCLSGMWPAWGLLSQSVDEELRWVEVTWNIPTPPTTHS